MHNLDGVEIPGPLNPLANVLLVKVKDAADISAGGIVLPDQVCTRMCVLHSFVSLSHKDDLRNLDSFSVFLYAACIYSCCPASCIFHPPHPLLLLPNPMHPTTHL